MARKQKFLERPKHPNSLREACKLIGGLWVLVQDLRAINERLGANSTNSSTPPSQDLFSGTAEKEGRRKPSSKRRGAQPGHVRNTRKVVPESEVDQIERHFPNTRSPCGGGIVIDADPKERHQIFDLPNITYTVTEHQRFGGTCPCCNQSVVAKLPKQPPPGRWVRALSPGLHSSADTPA